VSGLKIKKRADGAGIQGGVGTREKSKKKRFQREGVALGTKKKKERGP